MNSALQSLSLDGVSVSIGGKRLFDPLNLEVRAGEVVTLMGQSGCGKSTLLAFLCGIVEPWFTAAGKILLDGGDVTGLPPEQRRIGILFQDDLLFPHLSVGENLGFGIPRQISPSERQQRIETALADAGLDGFAGRDPGALSGGQRARVAVMRTLLAEPRALLLDEPFSKLDSDLRGRFRRFVFDHARRAKIPTLLVTHDKDDANAAGGTVLTLV